MTKAYVLYDLWFKVTIAYCIACSVVTRVTQCVNMHDCEVHFVCVHLSTVKLYRRFVFQKRCEVQTSVKISKTVHVPCEGKKNITLSQLCCAFGQVQMEETACCSLNQRCFTPLCG